MSGITMATPIADEEYNRQKTPLERSVRLARRAIGSYTANDVHVQDQAIFHAKLDEIRTNITSVVDEIDIFIELLQHPNDAERKGTWEREIGSLISEEKNNAKTVKDAMARAIDAERQCVHKQDVTRAQELAQAGGQEGQQAIMTPSITAMQELTQAEATRVAAALREIAKIKQKQENLKTEVDSLVTRMGQVQASNDSTDDEIRTLTLQTEKWKTEVISMNKKYMEMLVESAGLESEEVHTNNNTLKTTLDRGERCVKDTSKTVLEHNKRGLYIN